MSGEVVIVPYNDGPYLVRGPVVLRDQNGGHIEAGRRTIALCRCGKSRIRPFCDGTHRTVRFQAPSEAENRRLADIRPVRHAPAPGSEQARLTVIRQELGEVQERLTRMAGEDSGPARASVAELAAQVASLAARLESEEAGR